MNIVKKIKSKFFKPDAEYSYQFECSLWQKEQIMLGKQSGIDTSVYDYDNLSTVLMEAARKQLERCVAPSLIAKIVTEYFNGTINDLDFEELCENSIYVLDIDFMKEKFKVNIPPKGQINSYTYPVAFYGSCFGDIAGSKYEFGFRLDERKELNYENCICSGSCITDDTILSCATAMALENKLEVTLNQLSFYDYTYDNQYPFLTNPFSLIYKKYARMPFPGAAYGGAFYSWASSDSILPYGSMGNGAAMRVSPIADYYDEQDDVILYSIASAVATHNHYEGVAGAVITSVAIWMAKHGYSKQQIFDYIIQFYPPEHTNIYIKYGIALKDFTMEELKKSIGPTICPFSVPAAAICFYYADSFENVINNVLSFQGDTDTIGAIAGGIAGAYYGVPDYAINIVNENKPKDIFDEALKVLINKK